MSYSNALDYYSNAQQLLILDNDDVHVMFERIDDASGRLLVFVKGSDACVKLERMHKDDTGAIIGCFVTHPISSPPATSSHTYPIHWYESYTLRVNGDTVCELVNPRQQLVRICRKSILQCLLDLEYDPAGLQTAQQ